MTDEKQSSKTWLSEGILVAAVPFFGYVLGFVFEAGYGSYYDIPARIIELDFITVVIATGIAAMYVYLIFIYIQFAVLFGRSKKTLLRVLGRVMYWAILPAIFVIVSGGSKWAWAAFGAIVLLNTIDYFLVPLLFRRQESDYWARVEKRLDSRLASADATKKDPIVRVFDHIEAVASAMLLALVVCFGIGRSYAESERAFWVIDDASNAVLLRKYGDMMVLKGYDAVAGTFSKGIQVHKLTDGDTLLFKKTELVIRHPKDN